MIPVSELRVGVNVIEKTITYSGLKENIITVRVKDIMNNDNLYPIQLTEEMLINNGVVQSKRGFIIGKLLIRREMELGNTFSINVSNTTIRIIEYLHELQNIVFYLEEKELTINI